MVGAEAGHSKEPGAGRQAGALRGELGGLEIATRVGFFVFFTGRNLARPVGIQIASRSRNVWHREACFSAAVGVHHVDGIFVDVIGVERNLSYGFHNWRRRNGRQGGKLFGWRALG